jgi:hypothetical protein
LPSLVGSYITRVASQPFGLFGAVVGSIFFLSIWDWLRLFYLVPRDFYILFVGEFMPSTIMIYWFFGVAGGFVGWVVKLKREGTLQHLSLDWVFPTLMILLVSELLFQTFPYLF